MCGFVIFVSFLISSQSDPFMILYQVDHVSRREVELGRKVKYDHTFSDPWFNCLLRVAEPKWVKTYR